MKAKIGFLLTAFLMLFSVSANAQSDETPIKGDVNGDGVVDIADINAIIDIMKNGGGTEGKSPYYFYVGLEKPTSATNPAANMATGLGQMGWYLIGYSLDDIDVNNKAYDNSNPNNIIAVDVDYSSDDGLDYYIVIPEDLNIYDGLGNNITSTYTDLGTIDIQGHTYKILKDHDFEFIFNIY
jgi:hypothetical protein